jgi:hypothetical protein
MKGRNWVQNKLDRRIFFLVVIAGISILFTFMKKTPLRVLTDSLIIPFVFYLVAKRYSQDKWFLRAIYYVIIVNILFCGLLGMAEKVTHRDLLMIDQGDNKFIEGRIDGPFGNAEEFGLVMIIFVLFVMNVGSSIYNTRKWKRLRVASILLGVFGVLFTLTRGIWIALVAGLITKLLLTLRKSIPIVAVLFLAVLILIPVAPSLMGSKDGILSQRIGNQETIFSRLATFQSALKMFQDRPLIGVGYGVFAEAVERNSDKYMRYYRNVISVYTPHNVFLGTLAETGIAGLLAVLMMFITFFEYASLVRRFSDNPFQIAWANAIVCISIAYLVDGLGHDMTRNLAFLNKLFFLLIGVSSGFTDRTREMTVSSRSRSSIREDRRSVTDPHSLPSKITKV